MPLSVYCFLLLIALLSPAAAQSLPDKIRGYKVHQEKITVNADSSESVAAVKIGEPELIEASLTGFTFEFPAEIRVGSQSGKVDLLSFRDFKVNGISVEPEEFVHKFEFRKREIVELPKPARVFLPTSGIVKAGWNEMHDSKAEWTVTGRVYVFGRFRKFGFYHKRVVPIDIDIKIANPLRSSSK